MNRRLKNAEKRIAAVLTEYGDDLNRDELLLLAELPNDFRLRPWPYTPSSEEVMAMVGRFFFRHGGELTTSWDRIHNAVREYPPLVQELILKSFGKTSRTINGREVYGYGFDPETYKSLVNQYRQLYEKAKAILSKTR